ncbi:hypothetical protein OXIME_001678 [Oxyplasma meridianum]|uniref:Uncharacterized protein n=1 Tax=Oxyplasma meridianum TaxID=3073602 RepID=A0AAX4NJE1_9ARCH
MYFTTIPWFVSKVALSPENLGLHAYLDGGENCRWQQLKYGNNPEYGEKIHERAKPETAM